MMGQAMDPDWLVAMRRVRRAVVFTGAGVSAESGIATFRDALSGLWARYDPASMATAEAFAAEPDLVWGWYQWRLRQVAEAQPNPAHRAIAALATRVEQLTVVTQNVDDLHERAGSRDVIHLHGSLSATRCFDCARPHQLPNDVLAEVADWQQEFAAGQLNGDWPALVALDGEQLLGGAALARDDLLERPELGPWLACVYVQPQARGQGLAERLIEAIMVEARRQGYQRIYLHTHDRRDYYARRGWQVMEQFQAWRGDNWLMQRELF